MEKIGWYCEIGLLLFFRFYFTITSWNLELGMNGCLEEKGCIQLGNKRR